jgi:flavin reductase (DIM6/NTAB) family NADH-FMN oxidoreductase RutF
MLLECKDIKPADIYKITSNMVMPRPIAWITTQSENSLNIAPFSYFMPLSSNPALLLVSIGHKI